MKKILGLALCVIVLFTATLPVLADRDERVFSLTQLSENELQGELNDGPPSMWEVPTLKAGDTTIESGTFTLVNHTETEQTLTLRTVAFPYENEAALVYLNHLHISVFDNESVLYDDVYSCINNKNGLSLTVTLAPGEEYCLYIDMYCDYAYTGNGWGDEQPITWEFDVKQPVEQEAAQGNTPSDHTATTTTESSSPSKFSDPALKEILIACGIAVALIGGVFAYDYWSKRRR